MNDHSNLFNTADRYENLRGLTDYKLACQYVVEDGYCSDPGYAENLIGLIEDYELYRYDVGDVDPGEVTRVALSESNITLRVGQSFSLEASVYPATATDKSVTWSSSDTSVATAGWFRPKNWARPTSPRRARTAKRPPAPSLSRTTAAA